MGIEPTSPESESGMLAITSWGALHVSSVLANTFIKLAYFMEVTASVTCHYDVTCMSVQLAPAPAPTETFDRMLLLVMARPESQRNK